MSDLCLSFPSADPGVAESVSGGKFWEVRVVGTELTTTYGKLGDGGNTSTKDLGDEAKAIKEAEKLVKQKEKKVGLSPLCAP